MNDKIITQNPVVKLHPIFNDQNKEFFVSTNDWPPYEVSYASDDPLGRPAQPDSHWSSYIGTILRFDMRKLFLGDLAKHSRYLIELNNIELDGLLFKVTKGDKTEVVELCGLSGCATGKATPADNGRRNLAFKMSNFSSKLLRTYEGRKSALLDTENGDVLSVSLSASINLPHEKDVFNIADFTAICTNKTVNIELIGLKLNVYHLDTQEIFA